MERRRTVKSDGKHRRSESGVHRALAPQLAGRIRDELEAASQRIGALRSVTVQREAQGADDADLSQRALQEIEVAHEELQVLEEELHSQADELIETRERFARDQRVAAELFDAAPEAYLVTDEQGTIIQLNRRACLLFERGATFLVGKPLAALMVAEDRAALRDVLGAMGDGLFRIEVRVQPRKDAGRQWIWLSGQRGVRDESSICVRWLIRDITSHKEDEAMRIASAELLRHRVRELEASRAELSQLLGREQARSREADERARRKDHVLAEVAHELRTPLGAVAGWLHALSDKAVSEAVKSRAVLSMIRSVSGIANLVDELLEHARVENHQVTLKVATINLMRIVIEAMEDMRPLASLKGIRFDFHGKHPNIDINGDRFRLQQVLRNLIGNAIKFTPAQGLVRIAVAVSDAQAEVTISDTGRGIPREALSKIFSPFVQLDDEGQRTGLGIGLSIAKRLIELHGGSISADSHGAQRGATFRIRLPMFVLN